MDVIVVGPAQQIPPAHSQAAARKAAGCVRRLEHSDLLVAANVEQSCRFVFRAGYEGLAARMKLLRIKFGEKETRQETYANRVDIGLVPEKSLLGVLFANIPQSAGFIDAACHVGVPIGGEADRYDVPVMGREVGGFSSRLQIPHTTRIGPW